MSQRVVQPAETDIFERATALVGEVILPQQGQDFGYGHGALGRHQRETLLMQRIVHGDGHMALALVEEAFQFALDADTAHRDALRTPLEAVVGRQYLCGTEYGIEVIHRLSLSHENDIGQRVALRQPINLVQDVGRREVALPPLLARLTEKAVHLTAHLRRHTERCPFAIWNVDSLHALARSRREQIFRRAVLTALAVDGRHNANGEIGLEQLTVLLRDIGHLVYRHDVLLIEPTSYLATRKGWHTHLPDCVFQFGTGQSQ